MSVIGVRKELTKEGEKFIRTICSGRGNSLLRGKNKWNFPYTPDDYVDSEWISNSNDHNNKKILTNEQLGEALIFWFNKYAKEYDIDPNIIAAQAYAESGYKIWTYATNPSTASGISQITMLTVFDIIVRNLYNFIPKITEQEINLIISNLENNRRVESYSVKGKLPDVAIRNRPKLHQNMIDNPHIMIKAQCAYMKYIANNSDSLASTSLFCYNRGVKFMKKTYSESIEFCINETKDDYHIEGVNYVLKIFGILCDKNNTLTIPDLRGNKTSNYKPRNIYFGFDELDVKIYPNTNFNTYNANVSESERYGISAQDIGDLKLLSKEEKFKFIYFSEKNYFRGQSNIFEKKQIVLHHTVSGDNVSGDLYYWDNKGEKIATAFIVARDGTIFQLFSTDYWALHLGIKADVFSQNNIPNMTNRLLNQKSIGIEIDSWGGLINSGGNWYPGTTDGDTQKIIANTKQKPIAINNVITYGLPEYPRGFHGFIGFEKYTKEQIESVKKILIAINDKWKIPIKYVNDTYDNVNMWGTYNSKLNQWKPDEQALRQRPGVWTHVSFRSDKSDCHPQPELIDMLKSL